MKMFQAQVYIARRSQLKKAVGKGLILFMGNNESPINYRDNTYNFRQDSNFLYYFGISQPGLAAVIDAESGEEILFGDEFSIDDIIWVGQQQSLGEKARQAGIYRRQDFSTLASFIQKNKNRIHILPLYRHDNLIMLAEFLSKTPAEIREMASTTFIDAIIAQRSYKSAEEIEQMEIAVNISRKMHLNAMRSVSPGKYEYEIVSEIYRTAKAMDADMAYAVILSVHGQTLHNHYHGNILKGGQLLLNDSGAENNMFYAGDITRTCPVDRTFTSKQAEIYEIVLEMENSSIAMLRPGLAYREVHIAANKLMLNRLKEIGLVNGDVDEMTEAGVGGIFMPHGLGHMIGLDVHDMEDLSENRVGYTPDLKRSTQLGLKSLRLARKLETGFTLTVEPGIYFIPELLTKTETEGKFRDWINFEKLKSYHDFGGIRIEDNVLITADSHQILGTPIPKSIGEIEALR